MIWQLKITYRWLWLQKRKNRNYEWLWNHCPQINSRLRVHRGGYSNSWEKGICLAVHIRISDDEID